MRIEQPAIKGRRKKSGSTVKTPGQHGKPIYVFSKKLIYLRFKISRKTKSTF